MNRQDFVDNINYISELIEFCNDYGYESHIEQIYDDEQRNDAIEEQINERREYERWWEIRDWLYNLESEGSYDYWRLDDYGDWYGLDDSDFEDMKESVLRELDEDNFFDNEEDEESYDDGNPPFVEPVEEEILEPGNFETVMNGFENVPQFDAVIALNLARMRAEQDERVRVEDEFQRIVNESNNLTAGDLSAVFQ